jgi:hypothetical protein
MLYDRSDIVFSSRVRLRVCVRRLRCSLNHVRGLKDTGLPDMSKPSKALINPESVMNLDIMKSLHLPASKHRLVTMKEIHEMEIGNTGITPVKTEPIPKVVHKKKGGAKAKGKSPPKQLNEISKVVRKFMEKASVGGKKSISKVKKSHGKLQSGGKPSSGKLSTTKKTTNNMSMVDFKKYLVWHEAKKKAGGNQPTQKKSKK